MEALLPLLFTTLFYPILTVALLDPAGSTVHTPTTSPSPSPTAAAANKTTEYIRTSCQNTQYPELCYSSLSVYANAVHQNPSRLARAAIGVSLLRAKYTAAYFNNLARQAEYRAEPRVVAALHDCLSVLSDAVGQIKDSLAQIKSVGRGSGGAGGGSGSGETFRFQMSNVQTWMSAALTNEETCTDGLDDVAENKGVKIDGDDHIRSVEQVTSNALALVNSYVSSVSSP